jgi:hypothetical protein
MNEEEKLKEEKDRYERQNQEAYDEVTKGNEELRRKQEKEKKKGLLDEGSGFRTTLAIGTEVGLNSILDLFSADPTQLSQVLGAQGINYLAQRIRGGEFSRGEMIASGLASLIPGGAQAKSLGGVIGKTALRGGISGAIETGAADLIDTGKIDPERVAQGGVIGTTFGGLFGTAVGMNPTKVANTVAGIKARVRGGDFVPFDSGIVEGVGTVGAAKNPKGFQQLSFTKKGDYGKQLLRSNKPVANMYKRDGVVTLDPDTITQLDKIIDDLEAFHDKGLAGEIPKWNLDRPTKQYRGLRRASYTKPDGKPGQLYVNWSASNQTYVARDVDKLVKATAKRATWNVPQSGKKGQVKSVYTSSREANKALNDKLLELFDKDPELMQKIIGDTKQLVYVEHIHPGRSPYWNKNRTFGPGDPENLLVIEDSIFPKVKTAIEKQLYDSGRYKNIYADMDAAGDILLKDATTDKLIGRIPGITNQSQVKAGIYRALTGKQPMDLVDIDPTLRPYLAKLHGFDTEDFGRLKDVQAGIPSKAQDKFEEISRQLESKEVQLEASKTGVGKKLSVIKEDTLAKEIKALRRQIEQLKLFDTGGEGTGLRTQKQKIKIKKPKRVKKSIGKTEESVQIPIEYQGPKYKK